MGSWVHSVEPVWYACDPGTRLSDFVYNPFWINTKFIHWVYNVLLDLSIFVVYRALILFICNKIYKKIILQSQEQEKFKIYVYNRLYTCMIRQISRISNTWFSSTLIALLAVMISNYLSFFHKYLYFFDFHWPLIQLNE